MNEESLIEELATAVIASNFQGKFQAEIGSLSENQRTALAGALLGQLRDTATRNRLKEAVSALTRQKELSIRRRSAFKALSRNARRGDRYGR